MGSMWENMLMALMVLGILFWMGPGIKASVQRSKEATPDWMGFLLPIAGVILFVIFLIEMV